MQNVVNGCVFFLKLIHDGKKVKENEKFDEATVWEEKKLHRKKMIWLGDANIKIMWFISHINFLYVLLIQTWNIQPKNR